MSKNHIEIDGAYLTREGLEEGLNFLLKEELSNNYKMGMELKTCCIGF
jgi:hypothetical protein